MTLQAKPVKRLYNMEDEEMETRAQTMHDNLETDLALFTAKFPWLDAPFVASFQSDINTAVSFTTDWAVSNAIKVLTEDLDSSVEEGMRALDTLDIYARLAYTDSAAKQRVFGQDSWEKARNDQQKMFKALELAHSNADSAPYKAALTGKGMTQADIDNLATVAGNIKLKDGLQEKALKGRPVTTEDRIELHNEVWKRQQTISVCSELVFRDDAAKRAQYLLYPSSSGGGGLSTVVVEGFAPTGISDIEVPPFTPTDSTTVQLEIIAPVQVSYGPAEGPPMGATVWFPPPPQQNKTFEAYAALTGYSIINTFLKFQNNNPGAVQYKITFNNVIEG